MLCCDRSRHRNSNVMCHNKTSCMLDTSSHSASCHQKGPGEVICPQKGGGWQAGVERFLVACNMHVSEVNCMSSTYMSMYEIHGNDMMLFANDMLQQRWMYLCGRRELRVRAACCPVLPPSGLPHQFLLSCTLSSFLTDQKKGDFNFC